MRRSASQTHDASSTWRSTGESLSIASTSIRSIFPIAVNGASGRHCLSVYRELRELYGPEIHLTGGMSNVSFGLPQRGLLNDVFLLLALEAGADSGILDPIASPLHRVLALDRDSPPVRHAVAALTGVDEGCRAYLRAYRAGEL